MQLFLDQPTGLTEWRRSKGDDDSIFYFLPNGDANGHVAVSVYLKAHLAVVLNNIDSCGGYQSMSRFPLAELLSSYPSLEPEIESAYTRMLPSFRHEVQPSAIRSLHGHDADVPPYSDVRPSAPAP